MIHRAPDWTDRVLMKHADEMFRMDEFFRARREVENSKWYFMERRMVEHMSSLTRRIAGQETA